MATTNVRYIPVPSLDLLNQLMSGVSVYDIKVMALSVPNINTRAFKLLTSAIDFNTKDILEDRYYTFTTLLRRGSVTVKLTGNEKSVERYALLMDKIVDKHRLLKGELVELAALFEGTPANLMTLMAFIVSTSELDIIMKMVAKGGMDIHDLASLLKLNMEGFTSWEFTSKRSVWAQHRRLKNIRLMTEWLPARYRNSFIDDSIWMMPKPSMIKLALDAESVSANKVRQLGKYDLPQRHTTFSISTDAVLTAVMALQNMMATGVLVNGKSQVTATVIKKVAEALNLPQLPVITSVRDNSDIAGILAHLMLLKKQEENNFSVKRCMQGMAECVKTFNPQLGNFMLSRSLSPVPTSVRHIVPHEGAAMFAALQHVNSVIPYDASTWYDMESFRNSVIFRLTSMGHGFAPIHSYEWLGKLRLENGDLMPASEIKSRLFDVLLDSVILSFAAMGGYEFIVSNGKAIGLRLTRLGRWLVNPKSHFPDSGCSFSKEKDFEVDDKQMLIRVKNPSSPFLTTLKEFADPVIANHYRISDTKLLKGCQSEEELKSRTKQLEDFVIGTPGPHTAEHFNTLAQRFKSIVPTPDGTSYSLFDIRTDDRNLLRILTEDPEIIRNSLRVEGSRLLIKTSFLPKFVETLKAAGYPIVI